MKKTTLFLIAFIFVLGVSNLRSQGDNIKITSKRLDDKSIQISYTKKKPGSYYLNVSFPRLENSYPTIYQDVIEYASGNLIKLQPINPDKPINYSMSYNFMKGVPNPKVDTAFQYVLPFKNHKKIEVIEATNVNESFFGSERPLDWKAFIVFSKKADTVCSMRKGIVIEINNIYRLDQSIGKLYSTHRNSIVIEHEDGTIAAYKGFKQNSFFVKLGQTVYPQQQLGVIEAYNEDSYRLDFSVHYLFDGSLGKKEKVDIKNYSRQHRFVNPIFITANGSHKIKSGEIYVSESNSTVLLSEFSKKEKKKYKKNPELFQ